MAMGLRLEAVAPAGAGGEGVTLDVPAGALAVVAGREGAGRSRLLRVLMGMEAGRGVVSAGGNRHDLATGPMPPAFPVGAVLDPPALQSSLSCGANIRLGRRAAHRGRGRRPEDVVEALGIDPRVLDLPPQLVPPRVRQAVSLAQMLAAGKQAVVWDMYRADQWADVERARRHVGGVTWLVLVQPASAAVRHGQLAGILESGRVSCFGAADEVRDRLPFAIALRAERVAETAPAPARPAPRPPLAGGGSQPETSSR